MKILLDVSLWRAVMDMRDAIINAHTLASVACIRILLCANKYRSRF